MASDRATAGGISTPVNKRGTTTSAQEDRCDPGGELFYGFLPGDSRYLQNGVITALAQPWQRQNSLEVLTLGLFLCPRPRDEFLHCGQNPPHHDGNARSVRMHAVLLRQRAVGGDAIEKERIKDRAIFGRELRIDALKRAAEIDAQIGCGL